jgi:flagellar L-ring protein precursor FlgH
MEQIPEEPMNYGDPQSGSIPSRDYNGPLSLGDPGLTASLWRESRADNDLFRDMRAWQPMDLLTIVVSENAEGRKEADTETRSQSIVSASIESLLGLENRMLDSNPDVNLDSLVQATTQNQFQGEGETTRRGMLRARISAMVVEILPSGVLRIEGQKIISVNNEEQIMVISGIVRTRDISSDNEIDSSRIANMRVDYYGSGMLGEAQRGGWLGRIMRTVWPF